MDGQEQKTVFKREIFTDCLKISRCMFSSQCFISDCLNLSILTKLHCGTRAAGFHLIKRIYNSPLAPEFPDRNATFLPTSSLPENVSSNLVEGTLETCCDYNSRDEDYNPSPPFDSFPRRRHVTYFKVTRMNINQLQGDVSLTSPHVRTYASSLFSISRITEYKYIKENVK